MVDTQTWSYGDDGYLLSAANSGGTYTYGYNGQGQLAGVVEPSGVSLTFGYDESGNRNLVKDSLGGAERSVYGGYGELLSRTLEQGTVTLRIDQTFDGYGELLTQSRYSDAAGTSLVAETTYTYDLDGDVTGIVTTDASDATVDSFAYDTDASGSLASEVDNGASLSYGYDGQGQLTSAGGTTYSYDAGGNRTMSGYTTGAGNELTSANGWTSSYDADGNLAKKVSLGGGHLEVRLGQRRPPDRRRRSTTRTPTSTASRRPCRRKWITSMMPGAT